VPTPEEVERLALQEAEYLRGKTISLTEIDGFCDGDVVVVRDLAPPVVAHVLETTSTVIRWTDDAWCDPIHPVQLVDPPPQLARLQAPWVYGTARSVDGSCEPARFVVLADSPPGSHRAGEDGPTEEARPQPAALM
jgi:hypothetical protein